MKNSEEEIKKILYPHFGRLDLFKKLSETASIKKLSVLNTYIKDNKNILKNSDIDINSYIDYYDLLYDMYVILSNQEIRKFFISKLTNPARNYIKEIDKNILIKLNYIKESDLRTGQFLRRSSSIKKKSDLIEMINTIYNCNYSDKIEKIITNKNTFLSDGYYFLEMDITNLNICPVSWCLYNNPSQFIKYKQSQDMYFVYKDDDSNGSIGGFNIVHNGDRRQYKHNYSYQDEFNNVDYSKAIDISEAFEMYRNPEMEKETIEPIQNPNKFPPIERPPFMVPLHQNVEYPEIDPPKVDKFRIPIEKINMWDKIKRGWDNFLDWLNRY